MKKKMDLVKMTLSDERERFTRREVRNNLGDMLRETEKLNEKLFKKFWKEFFPKVTLSLKQVEFICISTIILNRSHIVWKTLL